MNTNFTSDYIRTKDKNWECFQAKETDSNTHQITTQLIDKITIRGCFC